MDATLRLRPLVALSAWMLPLTVAMADEPCVEECYETPALCTPTLDECGSGGCSNSTCGARYGGRCTCGNGCASRSGSCRGIGNWEGWDKSDDGHGEWFDDVHDNGPVGSSQKCHHGKMWPPYPRPAENGEWSTQFHAAMYWPHPYNCWDRSWVKHASAIQVANGWAQATTLYAYHFDPETHCLTASGADHLRWILEECPPQYRTVYVQSGRSGIVSDSRLASVRNEAAALEGIAAAPIQVRPVQLAGRPATEVDQIRRTELSTMPRPRVMVDNIGTGAGDGGQGSGGTGGQNNGSSGGLGGGTN